MPRRHEEDDVTLLRSCQEGDEAAWGRLVARYENLVYSVALRCGLDRDACGDVFQQVWVELYRSLPRIRDAKALPRWLAVSTRRLAYKTALAAGRQVEGVLEEMVDPAALPDDAIQVLEGRRRIEAALAALGDPCARLLRLLFLDDTEPSYRSIARRMGIAVGSIGPIRARCLKRLRRRLEAQP